VALKPGLSKKLFAYGICGCAGLRCTDADPVEVCERSPAVSPPFLPALAVYPHSCPACLQQRAACVSAFVFTQECQPIPGCRCESACDLTPHRLPTVTLVGHTINSSIQCVAMRGLGSDLDADRAPGPTPNNSNSSQSSKRCCERLPSAPSRACGTASQPFSMPSHRMNAPTTSVTPDMPHFKWKVL
jgi:hypothetical protein